MTEISKSENKNISVSRLLLFIFIGYGLSNIFRFDIFHLSEILEENFKWSYLILEGLLEGSGILLAGLLGLYLIKKERVVSVSFYGTSRIKSLIIIDGTHRIKQSTSDSVIGFTTV